MERNHKWNKDDTIICFYYTLYDLKGLPVKDEIDLAEGVIGTSVASLHMQSANIRFALGYTEGVLTDFSKMQSDTIDKYKGLSQYELQDMVIKIITKRDMADNRKKLQAKKDMILDKEKEIKSQKELDNIFRKMGRDPKKMKKIVNI